MTRRFRQMQAEERVTLSALRQQRLGLRAIAQVLGRNAGSLSQHCGATPVAGTYLSAPAQLACR